MPTAGEASESGEFGWPAPARNFWLLAGLAYSAAAMLVPPFTAQQYVVTGIPCAIVVAIAVRRGWLRPGWKAPSAAVPGPMWVMLLWTTLVGLAVAVQLFNYFDWPRDLYPTLSSLAGKVFGVYPIRVAAFALWLRLGWYLLDR